MAYHVQIVSYAIDLSENGEPQLTFTMRFDDNALGDNGEMEVTTPARTLGSVYAAAFGAAFARDLTDKLGEYRGQGSYSSGYPQREGR